MKKAKRPAFALIWLVMIPIQILLDLAMISLGAYADTALANPNALGHPAPGVVLFASVIAVIFTIIVPLASITITIIRFVILNKKYKEYRAGNTTD